MFSDIITDKDIGHFAIGMGGGKKWGYYVALWDRLEPDQALRIHTDHPTLDWATEKEAAHKAAAVLRNIADALEAAFP